MKKLNKCNGYIVCRKDEVKVIKASMNERIRITI